MQLAERSSPAAGAQPLCATQLWTSPDAGWPQSRGRHLGVPVSCRRSAEELSPDLSSAPHRLSADSAIPTLAFGVNPARARLPACDSRPARRLNQPHACGAGEEGGVSLSLSHRSHRIHSHRPQRGKHTPSGCSPSGKGPLSLLRPLRLGCRSVTQPELTRQGSSHSPVC